MSSNHPYHRFFPTPIGLVMVGRGFSGEIPRIKLAKIESRNVGVDFASGIKPDNSKLQRREKGKKEE